MRVILKVSLIYSLCCALLSASEDTQIKDSIERMSQPKVSLETTYISDSDISGSSGSFESTKNKISINNFFLGFSYTTRTFKWSKIEDLPFGDKVNKPIERSHTIQLDARLPYKINEKWFILNSLSLKSSFEDTMDDSYSVGIFSFASYKFDDEHTFQMGAFANYHPTTTMVLPIVSYSYRAMHRDGIKFVFGFPRTYVGYHLNRDTLISFGTIYSQSVVKLSNSSVIERGGYIETMDYMSNIGISYDFTKDFKIQADILYGLKREFTMYNSDGDSQETHEVDSALGANLRVVYTF